MFGTVQLKIVSASCNQILTKLSDKGIVLYDIALVDLLTAKLQIDRKDFFDTKLILEQFGAKYEIIKKDGLYWTLKGILHRPVIIFGVAFILFLILYLPTRILFISVEGNKCVSTGQIIEVAETCGMGFGASRTSVRSEKIKNQLLSQLPNLQWAGVNTHGCHAVITVEEKSQKNDEENNKINSNIIASKDGVILEITTTKGIPLCVTGQAVKKGQTLISGYADYGLLVKATGAEGEVAALTSHNITAKTLTSYTKRGVVTDQKGRYSLLLGKKLINLYKDSGISHSNCVRMYLDYNLHLPGGFQLPVGIVVERYVYYEEEQSSSVDLADYQWVQESAEKQLLSNLLGGQVLRKQVSTNLQDGVCILNATYQCREIISRIRYEEIMQQHE